VGEFAGEENSNPLVDIGWFWSLFGTFSGTQYVLEGGLEGESFGMIIEAADGEYLDYTFFEGPATHTLYGDIGSITFGRDLVEAADGTFSFAEELISFEGLDTIGLNGGVDANGDLIDRDTGNNDTHNIVNGLMNSDFNGLIEALTAAEHGGLVLGDEVPPIGVSALENLDIQLAA
jgi:heme acquisition protein HasA